MTSSPHGLYDQGYTRATMAGTMRSQLARGSQSHKTGLSSDWSLQLDSMKSESLVIEDQHASVNTFPGLVHTARHTMGVNCSRSHRANRKGVGAQGVIGNWGEVVTR
jgi:ribosomal protein L19